MSETPETENPDEPAPDSEPIDAEFAEVKDSRRGGMGAGLFVLAVLLATVLGGALGGAAAWWLDQRAAPVETTAAQSVDLSPLEKRIAALEDDLTALKQDFGQETQDPQARQQIESLQSRLSVLSETVNGLESGDPAPAFDPAPLTGRLERQESRIAALESRPRAQPAQNNSALDRAETAARTATAAQSGVASLQSRVTALEQKSGAQDSTAQSVFLYSALREAALGGGPFELQLAALDDQIDSPALGVLRPRAFAGIATEAELLASFPGAEVRAGRDRESGLVRRTRNLLSGLGTLRRAEKAPQDDPLDTARKNLQAGDLNAAINAMESLSGPAANAASNWLENARARRQAIAALDDLRGQLMESAP